MGSRHCRSGQNFMEYRASWKVSAKFQASPGEGQRTNYCNNVQCLHLNERNPIRAPHNSPSTPLSLFTPPPPPPAPSLPRPRPPHLSLVNPRLSATGSRLRSKYLNILIYKVIIWNRTRPRSLVRNQHTRELISARKTSHKRLYLWWSLCTLYFCICMPGESYRRRLRSLLLCVLRSSSENYLPCV